MANQYFTCELDAWREGTTLYGRMHYYRADGQTYTYTDSTFPTPTMNLGGTIYNDTAFADAVHNGINIGNVYTTTFSRTVVGTGTRTVTWTAGAGVRSDFEGTWSKDVSGFPGIYTAPDTPTISGSNASPTSNTITYGTTSFGNPSTGTVTLYGGTSANPTTVLDTYSSTGDHTFTHSGISPSTTYYYRAIASNGQLDSSYSTEISVTTADAFKLYGSVNGQTKEITKLYGSVLTPINYFVVTGILGNNDFDRYTFDTMYRSTYGVMFTPPSALQVIASGSTKDVVLAFSDNTTKYLFSYSGIYTNQGAPWGFRSEPVAGNVQTAVATDYFYKSKAITKLYGSVGGVTKRIF